VTVYIAGSGRPPQPGDERGEANCDSAYKQNRTDDD
jgi:hypothetical protein